MNPAKLRVLSFNLHSCIGVDGRCSVKRIAGILERLNPDLVALQEVTCGAADQLRRLTELWPSQYRFMGLVDKRSGRYGIAVLSRLNILESSERLLCKTWLGIPGEQRGVQSLLVQHSNGTNLRILNTHLALSRYHRRQQTEGLLEQIRDLSDPLVLLSDLNCGPKGYSHRELSKELKACSGPTQKSWPSFLPLRALDHIFVSCDIDILGSFVDRGPLTRLASDHLPLVADLAVP